MKKYFPFVIISVLFYCSCQKANLMPLDLVKWVENENNGLKSVKKIGDVEYSVQYRPIDYIIVNEEKQAYLDNSLYNKRSKELNGSYYYTLRIMSADRATDILQLNTVSKDDYYIREQYISFSLQEDICLVKGLDTIPCGLCHFVPNYGLSPYVDIMLAFENKNQTLKNNNDLELVYNDKIFGSGTLKFTINNKNIINTPSVITN